MFWAPTIISISARLWDNNFAAEGLPTSEVQKILDANTTEDAAQIISSNHLEHVYKKIAARASFRAERYVFGKLKVSTILVDFAGNVLGTDYNLNFSPPLG